MFLLYYHQIEKSTLCSVPLGRTQSLIFHKYCHKLFLLFHYYLSIHLFLSNLIFIDINQQLLLSTFFLSVLVQTSLIFYGLYCFNFVKLIISILFINLTYLKLWIYFIYFLIIILIELHYYSITYSILISLCILRFLFVYIIFITINILK